MPLSGSGDRLLPHVLRRFRDARQQNLGEAVDKSKKRLLGPPEAEQFPPDLFDRPGEPFFDPTR